MTVSVKGAELPDDSDGETVVTEGLVWEEDHYVLYIAGLQVSAEGWQEFSGVKYYINSDGTVTEKIEASGKELKLFQFDFQTEKWKGQKETWRQMGPEEYYFNKKGICILLYHSDTQKCQEYTDGVMKTVKRKLCRLQNGKLYYFGSNGIRVLAKGWQKVSGREYVEIGKKGYVVSKMKKPAGVWRYYVYHYEKVKWERQKNTWTKMGDKEYYFDKKGNSSRIYNVKTKKCKIYADGKFKTVKNAVTALRNGKLYYFNSKGVRVVEKGWKRSSGKKLIQVGKKGYVISRMEKGTKGYWKYFQYDYKVRKWQKQKKVWKKVLEKKYYFNGSGNCTRIYHISARTCYDVHNGKNILVKKEVRQLSTKKYYFGADGKRVRVAGMYLTGSGKLIYVKADGSVVREIPGQVLEYTEEHGVLTSCRVKDGSMMHYYNKDGEVKRSINMAGAMVALTYDDGPSNYTGEILDVLGQYGSTATFFVLGQRVSDYADIIKRADEMGCEIGNHTYSHKKLTGAGVSVIQSQIWDTNAAVTNVIGSSPVAMRPPGGSHDQTVCSAVGMPLILWSIDTRDWQTRNAVSTQRAVLEHVKDGDIILMHDLYSQTAEASRTIIPELVRMGYQLVTVSELADCRGGMVPGGVYKAFR